MNWSQEKIQNEIDLLEEDLIEKQENYKPNIFHPLKTRKAKREINNLSNKISSLKRKKKNIEKNVKHTLVVRSLVGVSLVGLCIGAFAENQSLDQNDNKQVITIVEAVKPTVESTKMSNTPLPLSTKEDVKNEETLSLETTIIETSVSETIESTTEAISDTIPPYILIKSDYVEINVGDNYSLDANVLYVKDEPDGYLYWAGTENEKSYVIYSDLDVNTIGTYTATTTSYAEQYGIATDSSWNQSSDEWIVTVKEQSTYYADSYTDNSYSQEQYTSNYSYNPNGDSIYVWVSEHGKKYHSNSNCSNMKNSWQITLNEAQNNGYVACKRCN